MANYSKKDLELCCAIVAEITKERDSAICLENAKEVLLISDSIGGGENEHCLRAIATTLFVKGHLISSENCDENPFIEDKT